MMVKMPSQQVRISTNSGDCNTQLLPRYTQRAAPSIQAVDLSDIDRICEVTLEDGICVSVHKIPTVLFSSGSRRIGGLPAGPKYSAAGRRN